VLVHGSGDAAGEWRRLRAEFVEVPHPPWRVGLIGTALFGGACCVFHGAGVACCGVAV